ncbi:MAG: PD-(D/E)XK nuclease family protein, partial [bacterium]
MRKKESEKLPGMNTETRKSPRPLDFSYSRMTMYEECPLRFKFRYVDRIPEKPKYYFAFGHSVHNALEFLYNVKSPPFPSMDEMLASFERDWNSASWDKKGYLSAEKAEADFIEGRRMLTAYYRKHHASMQVPLAVEYKTSLKIDGLSVMSVVDRIDYAGDGSIVISDYKTGKNVKRDPDQLHMYQKICETDPGIKELVKARFGAAESEDIRVGKLVFCHVPTLKESFFERSPAVELGKFWERVLGVAGSITAGRFDPTPGERQCKFCDYKKFCPIFAEGAVPPAAHPKRVEEEEPVSGEEALGALADRYGDLREELHS